MGKKSREKKERTESNLSDIVIPAVRQWMQPKEFRIEAPEAIPLEDLASVLGAKAMSRPIPSVPELIPQEALRPFLAELGTGLWRLKQRMVDPKTGQPLEEMRRPYRYLEAVWNVLENAGIIIHDHTGEVLPEGGFPDIHIAACPSTPGLTREQIIETIKPTMFVTRNGLPQDLLIQRGEVIVGTPEESRGNQPNLHSEKPENA